MEETTIATITWARSSAEERAVLAALKKLKGYSIISAEGGSRPRFIDGLHKLGVSIVCPKPGGLVAQVKASLRAALDASDTPAILYTEPDKGPFFEKQVGRFLQQAREGKPVDLCLAARDARSFRTFPAGQQRTESFVNESTAVITGTKADYCYGPILLSRTAAKRALEAPEHLGWGWRFWLLGRTLATKGKMRNLELPVPCPPDQRKENTRKDQIYRIKQARQNLEGLMLGFGL